MCRAYNAWWNIGIKDNIPVHTDPVLHMQVNVPKPLTHSVFGSLQGSGKSSPHSSISTCKRTYLLSTGADLLGKTKVGTWIQN